MRQVSQLGSLQLSEQVRESKLRVYPLSQVPQTVPRQLRQLATVQVLLPQTVPPPVGFDPVAQVAHTVAEEQTRHFEMAQVESMQMSALEASTW